MLTPSLLRPVALFRPLAASSAVSLTRCLPQGVDAAILLLGGGDVGDILYTAHAENGFPPRTLRFLCCDAQDAIIARNVLFLTLLAADGSKAPSDVSWSVYYDLFLNVESVQALQRHVDKLLSLAGSLDDWADGDFGGWIKFCDRSTFNAVREIWSRYADALADKDREKYRSDFGAALKKTREHKENRDGRADLVYEAARAAAPLGMHAMGDDELKTALDAWWAAGTTGSVPGGTDIPNPLFATALSENSVLSYTCDPILSYHLAAAKAHLAEMSPLKPTETEDKDGTASGFVATARLQFTEWAKAFVDLAPKSWILEFAAADPFALCHTLQYYNATGKPSANFYRRQLSPDGLEFDRGDRDTGAERQFDVIHTSDLWDHFGGLNLLISAGPLLKDVPWATLFTRTTQNDPDVKAKAPEQLLCAPLMTVSTLFGISPAEYWTNATATPNVDEHMLAAAAAQKSARKPGIHWRLAWKCNVYLSGHPQETRLKVKEDDMVALIHTVHQEMFFDRPVSLSEEDQELAVNKETCPKYHHGSLVAFMKRLQQVVDFDTQAVCNQVLDKMYQPQLSLELSRQGLCTRAWLAEEADAPDPGMSMLSNWSDIPESVFISMSVPKYHWKDVYSTALVRNTAFAVEGYMTGFKGGKTIFHNVFADVQVIFGTIEMVGERDSPGFSVTVKEDKLGWAGESDIVATFPVPAKAVQWDPNHTQVGLCLQNSVENVEIFSRSSKTGQSMQISETSLKNGDCVFITKNPPGLNGHPIYCGMEPRQPPRFETDEYTSHFTVGLDSSCQISSITGHLDVLSPVGKKLLAEKATVDVRKISPFVFEIVLGGREAVYLLHFPVPVVKDGSKTRVARTSSYIEVIAPLADLATAQTLDDFVFPTTLAEACIEPSLCQTIPVTLNVPHLNLDTLPILDASDKERLSFLTTLASSTFSVRERKLREETIDSSTSGLAPSARLNFKESLFTMFMLASGLQGGQTGLFAIHHPDQGGIHVLLFVSALRLDGANASVALDAAVIPFTKETIESGRLDSFLLILRTLECCTLTVDDGELVLWKKVLPALVERCRTWSHGPRCEYARRGAAVPLSTEPGRRVLCSCGEGRVPEGFVSLPEWETAARFATRVAISPTFAVPLVEEVVDPDVLKGVVSSAGAAAGSGMGGLVGAETLRCRSCGAAEARGGNGVLKKCMRCLRVRYCSAECQRKDWKKHRMECGEAEVYGQ